MQISIRRIKWRRNCSSDGVRVLALLTVLTVRTPGILAQIPGQSNIEQNQTAERKDALRFVPQEVPPEPSDPREKELLLMRGSDEGNPNLTPLDQPPPGKPTPGPLDQILAVDSMGTGGSS